MFETQLPDKTLRVEPTLYRFVHRPHGRKAYFLSLVLAFLVYVLMFSVDTITTSKFCQSHHAIDPRTPILLDPRCNLHWLLFGPNLVSLGTLLWLVMSLGSMLAWWRRPIPPDALVVRAQWGLFVMLLGLSPISLIAYYDVLGGVLQPSQLQVDKVVAFCIVTVYGIFGAVVIEPSQFVLGVGLLVAHVLLVLVLARFGYFVYAPFLEPDAHFVALGGVGYVVLYLVFSYVYYGIHLLKVRLFRLELYDAVPSVLPTTEDTVT